MSLFTDLRDVFTAYANRIKGLAAADEQIKADLATLADITPIPDNSDLNNYGETGLYSIEYGNYTILHYPMDTIVASYLEVRKMTTGYVGQKLTMPGSGKVFTRSRYSNGNWNNWIQIPTPDTTLSQSGVPADAKAAGDALDLKADKATTYTKAEVDQMIEDVEVETDTTLAIDGAPADAKKVGDELSDIKADLNEILEQGILSHFAVDNDGYVCQKVEVV